MNQTGKILNIFITAGSGLLGKALLETCPSKYKLSVTYFPNKPDKFPESIDFFELNITNRDEVLNCIRRIKPDVIIHTAAIGNVDFCEKNKDISWATNVDGTKNIIEAARECDSEIIYISSNAVFDGTNPPYREEDGMNPLSYYGETKAICERLVRNSGLKSVIIRAILMYGWHNSLERQNMVTWILDSIPKGIPLKIVNDIYSNPLLSSNCADAIWAVIKKEETGVFHVAGADCISRYDFALKIAEIFNLDKSMITPVPNSYFTGIASRPYNTCLCTDKMEHELEIKPIGVEKGLKILKYGITK
jgi:dTDP-4-dehydrorhamnose reductase